MEPKDRLLVALDVGTLDDAGPIIEEIKDAVGGFKVGLELSTAVGVPQALEYVSSRGGDIFLDLKPHDIPNTVKGAAKHSGKKGVRMFNVHASAGMDALLDANACKGQSLLFAVTILTSLDPVEAELIYGASPKAKVLQFARDAKLAGLDGVICSPEELVMLKRRRELKGLKYVTPAIRPTWAPPDDQSRFTTPTEAIQWGADYIVVGRPITKPPAAIGSRLDAARRIIAEITAALPG